MLFARLTSSLILLSAASVAAQQSDRPCDIQPYRGATSAQGADAIVSMVNRGQTCKLNNFGLPEEQANPAHSGRILVQPKNGRAAFEAPAATYTPSPGFAGVDEFAYEAMALGRGNVNLRLSVRVRITVSPQ